MVRITVIWLSVKHQNFFSFQNVTYAYPPHAVYVPFIYLHIKVSRSPLEPNLSTWQFYFPCRLFFNVFFFFLFVFFAWSWIQFFFKEILHVVKIFCIRLSEIELAFRRAGRQCSGSLFSMLRFKKLYWMQIFNQYLSNKNDDTCPLLNTNISAWIELSLWRCKRCYEHSTVKFVSTRDYLIPPLCLHSWTSVSLRRLDIGKFLSLHFKDRDEDFLSKGSKDILHDNKIFSCTMELPNKSASLVVIFVLFCFHLERICDLMF